MPIEIIKFSDQESACKAIAGEMINKLEKDLGQREKVMLITSGGNSPARILPFLAASETELSRIVFISGDERIVSPGHEDSTEGMTLAIFEKQGKSINYIGLGGYTSPEDARHYWLSSLREYELPVSVALLGVGEDGHFSSFFPGRGEINDNNNLVLSIPETYPHKHNRLALNLDYLLKAELILIPVFGEKKKAVIRKAINERNTGKIPVSTLLAKASMPVKIYEV